MAAKAANVQSVAVTCGYANEASLREHTDNVYDSALEAVKFITL